MHLTRDEIEESIESMKSYLVDGGLVIVSYSAVPREDDERFFGDLRGKSVDNAFKVNDFSLIDEVFSFDELNRDIKWRNQVYKL